jgi:hypothetical protein
MGWKLFKITRHTSFAALPALVKGALMFITDENRLCLHNGSAWERVLALPAADWDTNVKKSIGKAAYPVGSYYVQYPDASSNTDSTEFPTSQRPATLFGGTWAEQWAAESVFFRTRGTESDDGRVNGKQLDQMQRITGYLNLGQRGIVGDASGALLQGPTNTSTGASNGVVSGRQDFDFNSGSSPDARVSATTSGETRVTNRRIKVWKRTA